jgi:hypothetical protein
MIIIAFDTDYFAYFIDISAMQTLPIITGASRSEMTLSTTFKAHIVRR